MTSTSKEMMMIIMALCKVATDSSSPWMYVLEMCITYQEEKFSPPLESELSLCLSLATGGHYANVPRADT